MAQMRLDKLLSLQLKISRKQAAALVRGGTVRAGERILRYPAEHMEPAEVTVSGRALRYQPFYYLLMNKPTGVLTAARDRRQPVVMDLVPKDLYRRGLQPVGRLDKDTSGLLLLTDDGALAHRLLSPQHHVWKTYQARLSCPPRSGAAERFAEGVVLPEFTCLPAELRLLEGGSCPLYEVRVREGKFHQVRRMFAAQGSTVTALCRTGFGPLVLPDELRPSDCRALTPAEETALRQDKMDNLPKNDG